ncbi:zinc-ribbon domain-containing protein [Dorea amylophila]|uniref:zinc-ribbon domain-containing protein n=1 Tax=Dorea amylophila TaxID=2981789 RepID=UPI0022E2C498|nr:zinc-ribbon domain-containing protein [Dorea amylophila]
MGKYCSKCGTELQEGAKFCKNCGVPVNDNQMEIEKEDKNNKNHIIYNFLDLDELGKKQDKVNEKKYICGSLGMRVISILIWIISLIYYKYLFYTCALYIFINILLKMGGYLLETTYYAEACYNGDTRMKYSYNYKSIFVDIGTTITFTILGFILSGPGPLFICSSFWCSILYKFPVVQFSILLTAHILGAVFGGIKMKIIAKELRESDDYNSLINKKNEKYKENLRIYESILKIHDEKVINYINKAILLLNDNNYEDCMANVRRALEYDLYKRIEFEGGMLSNSDEMNIWGYINFYKKDDYNLVVENTIRRECNNAVHIFNSFNRDKDSDELYMEKGKKCIESILFILAADSAKFDKIQEQQKKIDENIKLYEKKSELHIKTGNFEDALLNIRKTLESVVNGYIKAFHIICLYGHEKNLNGYIDMLSEKKIISEASKTNMHNIRMACNGSAHINNKTESVSKIQNLIKLMKKEEDIYFNKKDIEDTNKMIKENTDNEDPNIDFDISSGNYSEEEYSDFEEVYNNVNNDNPDNNNYYCEEEEDNYYKNDNTYRNPKHYGDPFYETDPFIQTDPYINNPWGAESIYEHDGYDED